MTTAEDILHDPKYRKVEIEELIETINYHTAGSDYRYLCQQAGVNPHESSAPHKTAEWLINHYYPNNPPKPTLREYINGAGGESAVEPISEQVGDMRFWDDHELEAINEAEMVFSNPREKANALVVGKRYQVLSVVYDNRCNPRVEIKSEVFDSQFFSIYDLGVFFKIVKKSNFSEELMDKIKTKAEELANLCSLVSHRISSEEADALTSRAKENKSIALKNEALRKQCRKTIFELIKILESVQLHDIDKQKVNQAMNLYNQLKDNRQ